MASGLAVCDEALAPDVEYVAPAPAEYASPQNQTKSNARGCKFGNLTKSSAKSCFFLKNEMHVIRQICICTANFFLCTFVRVWEVVRSGFRPRLAPSNRKVLASQTTVHLTIPIHELLVVFQTFHRVRSVHTHFFPTAE